jgi:hypothetical protein
MNIEHHPETAGRRYLRYLLHRSHEIGVPYLPVEALTDRSVRDWIEYLRERVAIIDAVDAKSAQVQSEETTSSPTCTPPPRARAPDGYRPAWAPIPEAADHDHVLDTYQTEDDHDIIYCTLCSQEW